MLEHFKAGSGRTLLSATEANKVVDVVNALLRLVTTMRGRNGVRAYVSDANIILEGDGTGAGDGDGGGDPGVPAAVAFKGEWNAGTTYALNDIVIRSTSGDMDNSESGTFISLADDNTGNEPPAGETMSNAHWTCLARGHWGHFRVINPANTLIGKTKVTGGRAIFEIDDGSPPTRVSIDPTDNGGVGLPAALVGKTLTFLRVTGCDPDTGNPIAFWTIGAVET